MNVSWRLLKRRLTVQYFTGLPLTLLGLVLLYTLGLFSGLIEDVVNSGTTIALDTRLAHLLSAFRSRQLVTVFLWITLLGKWQLVMVFAVIATLMWWIRRRREYIALLLLTILGSELMTFLTKRSLQRPRPDGFLSAATEHSYAFPSGHATIAVALYGFWVYVLFRTSATWKGRVSSVFAGFAVVLAIGVSRLYLGVHSLSDVLGGYLIGLLWLAITISIAEWRKAR